jgi:GrpB-like predicted nucleotidyltransferase (UPF0157 family)
VIDVDIDEPITVVAYDPEWPFQFNVERDAILGLRQFHGSAVEHFGSTAVPGLLSKPIVDILVGVEALPPSQEQVEALRSLSYESMGEAGVSGRFYFRKRGGRAFNVAVVLMDGGIWRDNLLVREYLRAHRDVADGYGQLKSSLISSGDRELLKYSSAKKPFMDELMKSARVWKPAR